MDELVPGSAPGGPLHQPAHTVIEGSPGKVPSSRTICPQVSEGKELRRKEKNSADQAGPNWIVTSSVIYKMLWNISFPFAFNLKPQQGILEAGGEIWGCVPSDSWSSGATVWWSIYLLLGVWLGSWMHYFCSHLTGKDSVIWLHLTTQRLRKIGFHYMLCPKNSQGIF